MGVWGGVVWAKFPGLSILESKMQTLHELSGRCSVSAMSGGNVHGEITLQTLWEMVQAKPRWCCREMPAHLVAMVTAVELLRQPAAW